MYSTFASKTAFLVTTEWARRIEFVKSICPNNPGSQLIDYFKDLAAFVGPDSGAKSVRRIVCAFKCFLRGSEGHYCEHWPKNFFLRNPVRGGYSSEEGRRIPKTPLWQRALG